MPNLTAHDFTIKPNISSYNFTLNLPREIMNNQGTLDKTTQKLFSESASGAYFAKQKKLIFVQILQTNPNITSFKMKCLQLALQAVSKQYATCSILDAANQKHCLIRIKQKILSAQL